MVFDILLKHLGITKNELTNREYLELSYTQITDISALSGLINLKSLSLHNTQITDISALSGLTKFSIYVLIAIQHLKIYNKYYLKHDSDILNNIETLIFDTMKEQINDL